MGPFRLQPGDPRRARSSGSSVRTGPGRQPFCIWPSGCSQPTAGTVAVLGGRPADGPAQLGRVGFVAQDTPTYPGLSIAEHLHLGAWLNPGWDRETAERRIGRARPRPGAAGGKLSGGQRAQLALTLAMAKRPELLILDEPVASLDPLARREFLRA